MGHNYLPALFGTSLREMSLPRSVIMLMQEMGIKNTQYIIVRHHNMDNEHLHIVYNRIDNDLKLISVDNDYKRNIKVCKKLKDKHGLTYGKGKDRVKREKLNHPDKAKYQIYDAIRAKIVNSPDYKTLESLLKPYGVAIQFKLRRRTNIIEGSFVCKKRLFVQKLTGGQPV